MVNQITIILISLLLTLISNMVPSGYSVNSCGNIKDYEPPKTKSDCYVDKNEGYKCCFIESKSKNIAYCSYIPGKIDNDIINNFKDSLKISDLNVECNYNKKFGVSFILIFTFVFLLF